MKASNSKGDARTVGYEGGKIHCLWRALEQGLFPFMMNEVGELTEKNKVFVAVCEAAVKPETFEYAKWKGIGRPPGRRGGCRSATTLRPYPSGRRPRTESASSRNLNQTSRNPGARCILIYRQEGLAHFVDFLSHFLCQKSDRLCY